MADKNKASSKTCHNSFPTTTPAAYNSLLSPLESSSNMSRTPSKMPNESATSRKVSDPSKLTKLPDSSPRTALSVKDNTNSAQLNGAGHFAKQTTTSPADQKKLSRRGSKPIINWFQRKLAARARRASEGAPPVPNGAVSRARPPLPSNVPPKKRVVSTPAAVSPTSHDSSAEARPQLPAISLNEVDLSSYEGDNEDRSTYASSAAHGSLGAHSSALEADDDASVRPIAPSIPPSPTGSRSSASYLSDPHTFRSLAASTKPTTVLSVDLPPAGVAHIAQAPTAPSHAPHSPHVRQSSTGTGQVGSGGSITFSALPPSPSSSRPTSPLRDGTPEGAMTTVQAPLHTAHHPRNNPRPSSPPQDNASMLTLASSAFAVPGRFGMGARTASIAPSGLGASDSISHFDSSMTEGGDAEGSLRYGDDERLDNDAERDRDVDASVRALRPRSERQGSWGSEMSGWSAKVGGAGTSLAGKSLWTNGSIKTGGQLSMDGTDAPSTQQNSPVVGEAAAPPSIHLTSESVTSPISIAQDSDVLAASPTVAQPGLKVDTLSKQAVVTVETPEPVAHKQETDNHSLAATDNQTDFWVSAPSTPVG